MTTADRISRLKAKHGAQTDQDLARSLLPVAVQYMDDWLVLKPGDRLHRLVARLHDTYFDDLTDERIEQIERLVDTFRITDASGLLLRRTTAGDV